jgi:hypothetical protein
MGIRFFYETWNTSGGGYKFVSKSEQIKVARPSLDFLTWNHANLTKDTYMIFRETDNYLLGTYTTYLRIGGAIVPRPGPDSFKRCRENIDEGVFMNTVFVSAN